MKRLISKVLIAALMYVLTLSVAYSIDNAEIMDGEDGVIDSCLSDLNEEGMTGSESEIEETNEMLEEAEEQDAVNAEDEDAGDVEEEDTEEFEAAPPVGPEFDISEKAEEFAPGEYDYYEDTSDEEEGHVDICYFKDGSMVRMVTLDYSSGEPQLMTDYAFDEDSGMWYPEREYYYECGILTISSEFLPPDANGGLRTPLSERHYDDAGNEWRVILYSYHPNNYYLLHTSTETLKDENGNIEQVFYEEYNIDGEMVRSIHTYYEYDENGVLIDTHVYEWPDGEDENNSDEAANGDDEVAEESAEGGEAEGEDAETEATSDMPGLEELGNEFEVAPPTNFNSGNESAEENYEEEEPEGDGVEAMPTDDTTDLEELGDEFEVAPPTGPTVEQVLEANMMAAEANYYEALMGLEMALTSYVDMLEYKQYCYETIVMYAYMIQEMEETTPDSPFIQMTIDEKQWWIEQFNGAVAELGFLGAAVDSQQAIVDQKLQEMEAAQQLYYNYLASTGQII